MSVVLLIPVRVICNACQRGILLTAAARVTGKGKVALLDGEPLLPKGWTKYAFGIHICTLCQPEPVNSAKAELLDPPPNCS